VDGLDLAKRVLAATGDAPILLALDGVGDTSPMNLMGCLPEGGVLVSYGGMSRRPMVVQPGSLIFKKQTIRGFWLLYWYQSAKPDEITAMFDHLAPLVAAGTISTPVAATYRFDQLEEAVTRAAQRGGKVLFTLQP
jgi:NADPH:quinone reductase-like Zn-dependent oxidoreductase